jgi:hypothetical protein
VRAAAESAEMATKAGPVLTWRRGRGRSDLDPAVQRRAKL